MYFVLILLLFYSVSLHTDISYMGCTDTSPWWTLFTYNLVHVSFIHFVLNSFVIYSYWRHFRVHLRWIPVFTMLATVSAVAAMLAAEPTPTVGASAVGYGMIGIFLSLYNLSKVERGRFLFLVLLSFVTTGLFAPHINTELHIASFVLSLLASRLARRWMVKA